MSEPISRGDLREATLAGVRWVTFGRIAAEVAGFGSAVLLARLVPPAEFGVVAVALIVNTLALVLAAQGFAAPIVQRKTITQAHLESTALLSLVSGLALTAVVLAAAPFSAGLFGDRTAEIIQFSAPAFLVASLAAVPNAMLQRRLEFRRTTLIEFTAVLAGVALSCALAIGGLDAEAIVFGTLAKTAVATVLYLAVSRPLVLPRWHRAEARELAAFGAPAAGASLGYAGFRNIDYAIIAATLGPAQVGFYWRAYHVSFEYQQKISAVMQRVAFPVFSRSRDLRDVRALRQRIVRVHAVVIFPLLFMLIATAPVVIPWLFGPAWEPAVTPTQILGFAALATPIVTGVGPLLLAVGHPRQLMIFTWLAAIGLAAVVLVAAPYGITVVCFAVLGYQAVKLGLTQYFLLYRLVGITVREVRQEVAPGLLSGVALLIVALPVTRFLEQSGIPSVAVLACAGLAGGLVYLAVLRWRFADAWSDLALLIQRVGWSRRAANSAAEPTAEPAAEPAVAVSSAT